MTVRLAGDVQPLPDDAVAALGAVVGAEQVLTSGPELVEAGQDWWPITIVWMHHGDQPALPAAVVAPGSTDEVAGVLRWANERRVPVTPFAGRSGVCGGSLPVHGGISLDLRRLDRVLDVDAVSGIVHSEAGVFGPALEEHLSGHDLTVGHFPQSFDLATVGGWIACRGAGQLSNRYGKIEDIVLGVEVVLADGRVLRTNAQPAAATGPDLQRLFVGAEGTLGVITSAWLRAWPTPQNRAKRAWSFDRFADGIEATRQIVRAGARPACLRLYDGPESARHFEHQGITAERNAFVVLAEGDADQVAYEIGVVERIVGGIDGAHREDDAAVVDHWLESRNDVSALHKVIGHGLVVDTCEIAGPWAALPGIYNAAVDAMRPVTGHLATTAHASHAYLSGGCLYFTFAGAPGDDPAAKDAYYIAAWDAIMGAVRSGGGTISHHHGIGLVRGRHLAGELGEVGMDVLRGLKATLDPHGILNPGKLGLGPQVWP